MTRRADIDLRRRETRALELMDDPDCDPVALRRTYDHFALVNGLVSSWKSIYRRHLRPLLSAEHETTLLDVGSGGGDVARALAGWARRDGVWLSITAIDPDPRAHAYVLSRPEDTSIAHLRSASRELVEVGAAFDLVVSNHVLHHLDPEAFGGLLRDSERLARRLVIHNDIARGHLAYAAYAVATTGTFRGSFIHHDGLLSIRRSYTPSELREEALAAGRSVVDESGAGAAGGAWRVEKHGPFRVLLTLQQGAHATGQTGVAARA